MMPVMVGGKPHVLVVVGDKFVVFHMCVVVVVSLEGVRLPMVTMTVLQGRSRAKVHRVLRPHRGGILHLRPVWHTAC
jgi:hypothetical protein